MVSVTSDHFSRGKWSFYFGDLDLSFLFLEDFYDRLMCIYGLVLGVVEQDFWSF